MATPTKNDYNNLELYSTVTKIGQKRPATLVSHPRGNKREEDADVAANQERNQTHTGPPTDF